MKRRLLISADSWIVLIFIAGIFYIAALQLLLSDGAFFTGDSGLKALLTENLAAGNSFDIKFTSPAWVQGLWGEGQFPYYPPFMYDIAGRYFITFPYPFSLVNVPFYILLGYRGLFVIPILATLGTWILFYLLCRKLDLGIVPTAIGGILLIFATNLTLYSALYWEHTLAVFLSFAGLYFLFPKKAKRCIQPCKTSGQGDAPNNDFSETGTREAIFAGILTSLAVWFREEEILLVIFIGVAALISVFKYRHPVRLGFLKLGRMFDGLGKTAWAYLLSAFLTLCLYGLTNWLIYGNYLGVHTLQVVDQAQSLHARLLDFIGNLRTLTIGYYSLFLYVPIVLFPIIYLVFSWVKPGEVKNERDWNIWYAFLPFFILGVAVMVPAGAGGKQWGPRFLLLTLPVMVLLTTWQLDRLLKIDWKDQGIVSRISLGLVLMAGIAGIIQNPLRGSQFLGQTYTTTKPVITELRSEAEPVVAVSDPFLAQTFQPTVNNSIIFLLVSSPDDLGRFSATLAAQNLPDFSYLCYSFDCKLFALDQTSKLVDHDGAVYNLQIRHAIQSGIFTIFDVKIEQEAGG